MMHKNPKGSRERQAGFSLVEISLSMIIIGLLLAGLLHAYQIYKRDKVLIEDRETHEKVITALHLFMMQNNRYPCPARLDRTPANTDFGTENCTAGAVMVGTIPVKALNLPYRMVSDAYDNKITYGVSRTLTNGVTTDDSNDVNIHFENGDDIQVPFVLVSHGMDGKGAIARYGTTARPAPFNCAGGADTENCDNDADFRDYSFSPMDNISNAAHFDDYVSYGTVTKESSAWAMETKDGRRRLINKNDENVGIGMTVPPEKLSVAGDVRVDCGVACDSTPVVEASGTISASRVRAEKNLQADTIEAEGPIQATVFYYDD